ncbi:MAG: hypothetical protein LUD81_09920 [Clostridiales bacterium]|nr:hypothetical protein [Clostridiales bacterium]
MKRKTALILSVILAVGAMVGCGGDKSSSESENVYTSEDGSFSIALPSEEWAVTSEDSEQGMYVFNLPADEETVDEKGIDSDAIILYFDLSEESGNLGYDTIPTTEEELTESLGEELSYEVQSFEGEISDDGVKSNFYTLKFYDSDGTEGYIVSRTSASETEGYIAAGEILYGGEELAKSVEESIKSIVKN